MLLPDEPAGMISTSAAGVVDLHATLTWRSPDHMPSGRVLDILSVSDGETFRYALSESADSSQAARCISGEIRALTARELGFALDAALRAISDLSALSEAVLEVSAIRRSWPVATPTRTLEGLARDLLEAGFPVRFGPSWTPAREVDVSLGVRGARRELAEFLQRHPSWRVAIGA